MGSEGKEILCLGIPDVFEPFDARLVGRTAQALQDRSTGAAIETGFCLFKKTALANSLPSPKVAETFLGL
jgi:hypothetical protein